VPVRRMAGRLAAPLALAATAVIAAGCGSSHPSARAQLVAKADPICRLIAEKRAATNKEINSARTLTGPNTLKIIARTAPGVAAYETQAVAQLRTIPAPASLAGDWNEMLAGLQQLANDTALLGKAAKTNNVKQGEAVVASSRKTRQRLTQIATRDGFTYCGRTS
jgi:hypothetical protein